MASQSLYRKWRSQTFSDLIGQEAVVRTLLNAVHDGRLSHAYLFCGPHGTGKTSVARLLAKAINCERPHDGEPCGECVSCQEIASGRSPDVIEIDAASNNGVDDIRKLRETVGLMAGGSHRRVYIIDEAHMLSTQAWNALLKTLEEPPPHVIFVFATTEANKMLPTVVSRCQRFDFRRIRMADIVARLQHVADGEGLTLEPAAADLLARAAQGGLRDALSLLDQAVAFCGQRIDVQHTRAMLGLADVGMLRQLIGRVADDDAASALDLLNELVKGGADLRQVNGQLAQEWRALMLSRAGADLTRALDVTADEARELAALANRFSLEELMASARIFARNEAPPKGMPVPQLALELALLECMSVRRGDTTALASEPQRTASAAPKGDDAPSHSRVAVPAPAPRDEGAAAFTPLANGVKAPQPAPAPRQNNGTSQEIAHATEDFTPEFMEAPAVEEPVTSKAADPTHSDNDGRDWVEEAQQSWPLIRKLCRQKPPMGAVVGGLLSAVDPIRWEPGQPPTLVLRAKFDMHVTKLRDQGMRQVVEWALEQALGAQFRVHVVPPSELERGGTAVRKSQAQRSEGSASAAQSAPAPQVYARETSAHAPQPQAAPKPTESARRPAPTREMREAQHGEADGYDVGGGRGEIREQPTQKPRRSADALEKAAREDPVVKEFTRLLKTEVAEVRSLDDDDSHEE